MTGQRLHATAVAIDGRGVLILGASGRGKSDLALRLIDRGAQLIADDYVEVEARNGRLDASAPATIRGKMEVRGVGIVELDAVAAPIALVVDLEGALERLPEPGSLTIEGVDLPMIALAPFDAAAPIKVELALKAFGLPLEGTAS